MAGSHVASPFQTSPRSLQTSPRALQPSAFSTTNKPLATAPPLSCVTNQLGPQKEWTLPPRPKPGRKPAQNAPPTKRKAQNREAQRAFRERRAAKVGELEEQMKQMGETKEQKYQELIDQITGLHAEAKNWEMMSERWRLESERTQRMLEHERLARQQLELQLQMMNGNSDASTDAVPLKPRVRRHHNVQDEQQPTEYQNEETEQSETLEDITCGKCSNDSRCQCIEEAFELNDISTNTATDQSGTKRTLSPQDPIELPKRVRPNMEDIEDMEDIKEIDFTTRKPPSLPQNSSLSSEPSKTIMVDACGFCQDGTTCICAELTRHTENERLSQQKSAPTTTSCTNDPGNCAQCQVNPASKSFCTAFAASRPAILPQQYSPRPAVPTLKCADAFNRLAQHPRYPEASKQLTTWVPELAAGSVPKTRTDGVGDRPAFEIEAASVMGVLKMFDVRFGDRERD